MKKIIFKNDEQPIRVHRIKEELEDEVEGLNRVFRSSMAKNNTEFLLKFLDNRMEFEVGVKRNWRPWPYKEDIIEDSEFFFPKSINSLIFNPTDVIDFNQALCLTTIEMIRLLDRLKRISKLREELQTIKKIQEDVSHYKINYLPSGTKLKFSDSLHMPKEKLRRAIYKKSNTSILVIKDIEDV